MTNVSDNDTGNMEMNRKNLWSRLRRWEHFPLLLLVIFTLALHFSFIMRPAVTVGDETFYVNNSRFIINSKWDFIPEHPPLGKLIIISGIKIFGDNPLGWRFFSVLFGTVAIVLFYFICLKLKMSGRATLIATFLFALDDMFFVHASLGWLDIYMLTFMLAGFLLYLHKGYVPMGIAFALSVLCKFSGGLGILAVGLHWLLTTRDHKKQMIISLIVMVLSFLLLMTIFQYFITGTLVNPVRWTMVILRLTASKKFFVNLPVNPDDYPYSQVYYTLQPVDSAATRPWTWLIPHKLFSYATTGIQYLSFISWTIQILIIPALIYMLYKTRKGNTAAGFGISWFACTYLIWIPLVLITNRVTYDFYFLPTTGAICIGIGLVLSRIIDKLKIKSVQRGKTTNGVKLAYTGIALYLLCHLIIFIVTNPALPDQLKLWLKPIIK
jgi:predicted membrane-bound dolichyl-phosphate-mannose-protein mannosyltransferase